MIAGEKAPNFTLCDHTGRPRSLSGLLAEGPVVLFFFPIASSPICTAQACHFRDLSNEFARVGAQRVGISTDTVTRQAHFAQQRSFDYPLLSDSDGVVSEMFGVRRGRLAKLRGSVAARDAKRRGRHTRRRGLFGRFMPVRRTTFVIDTDRTVLKVVANEVRASVHADQTLWFLENLRAAVDPLPAPPPEAEDRIDSGIDLPLEAPIQAVDAAVHPPLWPKNDVRSQILTWSAERTSVVELAAHLSLPLGATRFLVDELVTQGYLRVQVPREDSLSERRELLTRTLAGLRAL
jgi:peroxiredoxin Q/BCP